MDEDEVIGFCVECGSDQPDQYMLKSGFAQAGRVTPCRFCGGCTVIVARKDRDSAIRYSKKDRKIDHDAE